MTGASKLEVTRDILEVLQEFKHPLYIITKSAMVERDLDLLVPMAEHNLVQVLVSVTTLDTKLSRHMEPRATAPARRLETIRHLAKAGVPVGVLVAPVMPVLTDPELESILEACRRAGAESAGYAVLRLPHELKDLFHQWLQHHEPLKAKHVMSIVRQMRGGKTYDATFGQRMSGTGNFAELLAARFALACKRLQFNKTGRQLDCSRFALPGQASDQLSLF